MSLISFVGTVIKHVKTSSKATGLFVMAQDKSQTRAKAILLNIAFIGIGIKNKSCRRTA